MSEPLYPISGAHLRTSALSTQFTDRTFARSKGFTHFPGIIRLFYGDSLLSVELRRDGGLLKNMSSIVRMILVIPLIWKEFLFIERLFIKITLCYPLEVRSDILQNSRTQQSSAESILIL